jgi:hypothetical protein
MIRALDSSTPPSAQQVAQAKAAGYGLWSGYLASREGVGLLRTWNRAEFDIARGCGAAPLAFCSGWDDPTSCKVLAGQWNVPLCLDVESGIRGDGTWVQAWLDGSGAGLYGNPSVFANRRAPFFVMAAYPGSDPGRTWQGTPPAMPHGWQYQGTTSMFGISVDLTYLDDWFGASPPVTTTKEDTDMTPCIRRGSDGLLNSFWIEGGALMQSYQHGSDNPDPALRLQWSVPGKIAAGPFAGTPLTTPEGDQGGRLTIYVTEQSGATACVRTNDAGGWDGPWSTAGAA